MSLEIKVIGLNELIAKLGMATAQETLEKPMLKGAEWIKRWSMANRLTGPRPLILGVKTGRLRSSLNISRSIKRDEFTFFIGTNVEYAPIHEFGGVIRRNARSSLQVFSRKTRGENKGQFKKNPKFGKGFTFGAYSINIPARPFLRPAIENQDNINYITDSINKSIEGALSK